MRGRGAGRRGGKLPAVGKVGQRPEAGAGSLESEGAARATQRNQERSRGWGGTGWALLPQPLTSPASRRSAPWIPETLTPNILEHFTLSP